MRTLAVFLATSVVLIPLSMAIAYFPVSWWPFYSVCATGLFVGAYKLALWRWGIEAERRREQDEFWDNYYRADAQRRHARRGGA